VDPRADMDTTAPHCSYREFSPDRPAGRLVTFEIKQDASAHTGVIYGSQERNVSRIMLCISFDSITHTVLR
jgi:hypothetical protein